MDTPSRASVLRNLARCNEFAESRPDKGSEREVGGGGGSSRNF